MVKKTKQIRILTDGEFRKLMIEISKQFEEKHGFGPSDDQVCESIARAVLDHKLFMRK